MNTQKNIHNRHQALSNEEMAEYILARLDALDGTEDNVIELKNLRNLVKDYLSGPDADEAYAKLARMEGDIKGGKGILRAIRAAKGATHGALKGVMLAVIIAMSPAVGIAEAEAGDGEQTASAEEYEGREVSFDEIRVLGFKSINNKENFSFKLETEYGLDIVKVIFKGNKSGVLVKKYADDELVKKNQYQISDFSKVIDMYYNSGFEYKITI